MSRALVLPGTTTEFIKSNALGALANARVEMRIRNLSASASSQTLIRLAEAMKLSFSGDLRFLTFFSLKTGESVSDLLLTQDPANSSLPRHFDYLIRWQFDASVPRYSLELWAINGTDRISVVTTAGVTTDQLDVSSFVSVGNDFSGFTTRLLTGSIDWLRIYNTTVPLASAAPASTIPAAGVCVANWEFEDSLADGSGHGHTMVWQGAGAPSYEDTPGGGTATQLAVTTQPGNAGSGNPQVPQPVVEFRDAGSVLVSTETSDVTASLVVTVGSGTAIGTLTETAAGGVADFAGNGLGVVSAGGCTAHWHLVSGALSVDTASFTISAAPSVPADVATLIAALGGNVEVDAFYDTEARVTSVSGGLTAWDDVRGSGYAPTAAGMKGAGAYPAWNASAKTITTDGSQNWLETALDTRFDMSGDATIIVIGAMAASGAFGVQFSTLAGTTKTYGLGMDSTGAYVTASSSAPVTDHAPPGNSASQRLIVNSRAMISAAVPGDAYQYLEGWGRLRRTAIAQDATMTAGTLAMTVGRLPGSGGGYSAIAVKVIIKVRHQLSMAEHDALVTFAAGRGVVVDSSAPALIADGDSLTFGLRASNPVTKSWLAQMITAHSATFAGWDTLKHGVSSRTLVTMLASTRGGTSTRQKDSTVSAYNAARARNIYVCAMGINDLRTINPPAATLQAQIAEACQTAKTRGFKVIAVTLLPTSDVSGTAETTRLAVNAYLRANYLTFADALADVASNPALTDPTNTTYYYTDQLHLIDAGYDEYGNDPVYGVWPAIAGLLSAPGTVDHLTTTAQPSSPITSGVPHATQPVVALQDASGVTVTTDTSTVTATLVVETGSATPFGTLTKVAVAGVANFAGNGLGATSLAGATAHWHFTAGGVVTASDSATFTISPVVVAAGDPFVVIAGITVPVLEGQAIEQLEQGGSSQRAQAGNLLSDCPWEKLSWQITTGLLTRTEVAALKVAISFRRHVAISGVMPGGSVTCEVTWSNGAYINTSTTDGTGILRSLVLLCRQV